MIGKGAYLKQLTAATMPMNSVDIGKEFAMSFGCFFPGTHIN